MASPRQDIEIKRGDTYSAIITVTDYLGNPVDITGYTFFFTMKTNDTDSVNDDDAIISQSWTNHTTPVSGITTLVLSAATTKVESRDYVYDIQMVDDGIVTTLKYGVATVKREVTVRTTA